MVGLDTWQVGYLKSKAGVSLIRPACGFMTRAWRLKQIKSGRDHQQQSRSSEVPGGVRQETHAPWVPWPSFSNHTVAGASILLYCAKSGVFPSPS